MSEGATGGDAASWRRDPSRLAAGGVLVATAAWSAGFIHVNSWHDLDGRALFVPFDDAMISMRYAWHLVHGHGLVWNPGERVEGFTNPLWTLMMAGAIATTGDRGALWTVTAIGIGFRLVWIALLMAAAHTLARGRGGGPGARAIVVTAVGLLAATYYPANYWSVMGMEVSLIGALTAAAIWVVVREEIGPAFPAAPHALGWFAAAAFLARPDAPLALIPLVALFAWRRCRAAASPWPVLAAIALPPIGAAAAITAARLAYFGEWLPNTYVLKVVGIPLAMRIDAGIVFVTPFIVETAPLAAVAVATVLLLPRRALTLALLAAPTIATIYQVSVGGDPWFYWRQMAPGVSALALVAGFGLATAWFAATGLFDRIGAASARAAVVAVFAAVAVLPNWRFEREALLRETAYQVGNNLVHFRIAQLMREVLQPDALVVAFWAGVIPYVWQGPAHDPLGKTDAAIARLPPDIQGRWYLVGHNKFDLEVSIRTLRPAWVQSFRWGGQDLTDEMRAHFWVGRHRGVDLCLRDDPAKVRWDLLERVGPCQQLWP